MKRISFLLAALLMMGGMVMLHWEIPVNIM